MKVMKAAKFNLSKLLFIMAGVIFLAMSSCTKDELDSPDSVLDERVDNMPENHEDEVRQYP